MGDVMVVTGALVRECLGTGVRGDESHCPVNEGVTESWSRSLGYLEGLTQFIKISPFLLIAGSLSVLGRQ